jgi:hypothetical protein
MNDPIQTIAENSFSQYIKQVLEHAGATVSNAGPPPHAEQAGQIGQSDGSFSYGITVEQGDKKASVGFWYRTAPHGRVRDVSLLLTFYREQLEPQGHGVYITTPVTELGIFAVLWDSEQALSPLAQQEWVNWAEGLSEQCFAPVAFSQYLAVYRRPPEPPAEKSPNHSGEHSIKQG